MTQQSVITRSREGSRPHSTVTAMIIYGFVRICISQLNTNRGDIDTRGTSCGGQNKESKNKKLITRTGARITTRIKNKLLRKERRQECEIEGFFIEILG